MLHVARTGRDAYHRRILDHALGAFLALCLWIFLACVAIDIYREQWGDRK